MTYRSDWTEAMFKQSARFTEPADNKVTEAVKRAAEFLGIEPPKPAAVRLDEARHLFVKFNV